MLRLEVQLRVPHVFADESDLDYQDPLLLAFNELLDHDKGEFCDDSEQEGNEICFYLYGPDQDHLIDVARTAITRFSLPAGIYAVKTSPGKEGAAGGERVTLI